MRTILKTVLLLLVLLALTLGARFWFTREGSARTAPLRTAPVRHGELLVTIAATGTVEPEDVVDVGAQVAGMVGAFGQDDQGQSIDYGSAVEEGTVLARIDDALYAADVAAISAQLEQARAGVQRAEADLGQLRAKLVQAERDWKRAQQIGPSDALAQASYDAYEAGWEVARANVGVGEATLAQMRASVAESQAAVDRAKRNLDYCTIRSPVKGVIIDRRVNIGQTVVSSLNAPSLFLIAKDLKRMQVWVAVNEADIGSIREGQPVTFTVDAFPGEPFQGRVGQVRLNATMTQNVVTYTVEVTTDNSNGKLLPYLTANVKFEVDRRPDVLMVPNAALRWTPAERPGGSAAGPKDVGPKVGGAAAAERRAQPKDPGERTPGVSGTVWVQEGDSVRAVRVRVGVTDGASTEIAGEGIAEGLEVVVGEEAAQPSGSAAPPTTNPFAPQMPQRGRRGT